VSLVVVGPVVTLFISSVVVAVSLVVVGPVVNGPTTTDDTATTTFQR